DDTAIAAVAEATGTSAEYVRLTLRTLPSETKRQNLWEHCKNAFLAFNPDVRRMVMGGVLGIAGAFVMFLAAAARDQSGFLPMICLSTVAAGIWNCVQSRSVKNAAISGAIQGAANSLAFALFAFVYQLLVPLLLFWHVAASPVVRMSPMMLPLFAFLGVILGVLSNELVGRNRARLGLHDPAEERHKLLQQLLEITDRLKSDEQYVTFLSVDIVGSTKMKADADALSVEFTFNEYHRYVEQVVNRHGGQIHSTAGDGVTCVFEQPGNGLAAAKAVLGGLFEFNAMRNRIGKDIQLRAGLHTGPVLAPGKDVTSVNFAHVIDVAAHMQKAAPIGGVLVSDETAKHCQGGLNALGDDRLEIQGFDAAVWKPSVHKIPVFPGAATTN
ncbi:MAG: adenylate/guanylate cyclase domain-containing protein, partial [Armatimonadota bacterium]